MSLLTVLFVVLYHLRDNFLHRAIDDVVGNGVDGSVRVIIDGDDDAAFLHAGDVLDLSANAAGDVEFRADGDTCLAYLAIVVAESRIDGCTAGAYFGMEFFAKSNSMSNPSLEPIP